MATRNFKPPQHLELFVNQISVFEADATGDTALAFYADGYPGIMFQQTQHGMVAEPHGKTMPELFLYGQTLKPVVLRLCGSYKLVSFQLYPFVLESFFGVVPKSINDDCHDLTVSDPQAADLAAVLRIEPENEKRIDALSDFLHAKFIQKRDELDFAVRDAILCIMDTGGQLTVAEVCERLNVNPRTLERKFESAVGVSPKQFATIVKFQHSFEQLASKDFSKLTDVVYENGFFDQSHFIRVFKAFTGKTPKFFT